MERPTIPPDLNRLGEIIIGRAIQVHSELGPGLLESIYESCLVRELEWAGLSCARQVPVKIFYKGNLVDKASLRLDLLVEDRIVVEVKAVEALLPIHEAQLLTYLRLSGKRLGYLLNFNVMLMKQGIRRLAN